MITRSTLQKWESNISMLSKDDLIELARYFESCINHFGEHQKIIDDCEY